MTLALVIGAELIPDETMANALVAAGDDGPLNGANHAVTILSTRADRWTECTALTMGLGDDDLAQPVTSALQSRSMLRCEQAAVRLQHFADTGDLVAEGEYFRYWWADTALLRPSVIAFGIPGSRVLFQTVLAGSFLGLLFAWRRRIGLLGALALLGPIVVGTDFVTLYDALPQAISLSAALLVSIGVLRFAERAQRVSQFLVIGGAAGAVVHPFDLMISIPLAATLCVATVVLVQYLRNSPVRSMASAGLAAGAGWGVGYGWVWLTKWMAIATVAGPSAVLANISDNVAFRVNGDVGESQSTPISGALSNVRYWIDNDFALSTLVFEGVLLAIAVLLLLRRLPGARSIQPSSIRQLAAVAATAALPFAWYGFASNHSEVHDWIMFRAVALSAGLVAVALILTTRAMQPAPQIENLDPLPSKELVHS